MPSLELMGLMASMVLIGGVSAIMGLGGGVFCVPFLIFFLGLSFQKAAALSLVCTLATSAAGSVALDKARLAHSPLVVFLEMGAVLGALVGASLAPYLPERLFALLFAVIVAYAGWRMLGRLKPLSSEEAAQAPAAWPRHYPLGLLGCALAGILSGMLGVGGGPVKVPLQSELMGVPVRVALANSNIMVGITAGAGAAVYFTNGLIPAYLCGPCVLGIALGAFFGGRLAPRLKVEGLLLAFSILLFLLSLRMLWIAWAPGV